MKQINTFFIFIILATSLLFSCTDELKEKEMDFPNDLTFNEEEGNTIVKVPSFGFVVPQTSYTLPAYRYGKITFNVKSNSDGTHTGFALSNKNYRSYPWCTSKPLGGTPSTAKVKEAVDSSIFSVYSGTYPNQLKNFAVVRVSGDDAFFTTDKPYIIEHVLVANTTYDYMLFSYGSRYSSKLNSTTQTYDEFSSGTTLAKVRNPNIPDASTSKYGVWYLPDIYGFGGGQDYIRLAGQQIIAKVAAGKAAALAARAAGKSETDAKADSTAAYTAKVTGYFKITAKGYLNGALKGSIDYYLAVNEGVAPAPYATWNTIQGGWAKWDLSSLGLVNKVVFYLDSSDKDANGKMRTPPYFCLDGIRIK